MKKIAIELFGQLRMWDAQNIFELEKYLNSKDISVDFFGTFWDDEYTNRTLDINSNIFKKLQLLEEPERNTTDLYKYFYSLSNSINQRKVYQDKYNINYDFIIHSRSDLDYTIGDSADELLNNLFNLLDSNKNNPCIFICDKPRHPEENIDDKIFIGNNLGSDNLESSFRLLEVDDTFRYHTSLWHAIKFCNCSLFRVPLFFKFNLLRTKFLREYNYKPKDDYEEAYLKTIQDTSLLKNKISIL